MEHLFKILSTINLYKTLPIGHIINLVDFTDEELEIFYKTIGENVRRERKKKNVTQMQLALAIGHNSVGHIAKAELYKYEKHFSLEQLYKIAKVLEINLHQLIP
ncbi:helix-turn-helix transcriptional regulator [Sulfurimonas sp. NWX79]|uniref:helix-turn-helix domain-containing protein n=1 Tax=Sulfurimonas sp. NWX79 TaxID=2925412 RepID=UPI003204EE1C